MSTFILIHGSWHGAWCWYKIKPRLEKLGHRVFTPDLPGHGKNWRFPRGLVTLEKMVKTITDIIDLVDLLDEKVTIVVHSRNGIVASRVAELRPKKIKEVIFLASFVLKDGEKAADYFRSDRNSKLTGNVEVKKFQLTDMIKPTVYREALYEDCDDDDLALAYSLLTPEPSLPAITKMKLTDSNFGRVRKFYIQLLQDQAVTPELQKRFIDNSKFEKCYSIEASHSAYFSKPDELTNIILNAAGSL
jgi:pimeloyl-ACP methyl ester carboxylesterase